MGHGGAQVGRMDADRDNFRQKIRRIRVIRVLFCPWLGSYKQSKLKRGDNNGDDF